MQIVKPTDRTTLILDQTFMPFGVITARAVIYHLLKNHGRFLDANMVPHDSDELHRENIAWHPNQPAMRSAHQVWPIPTIFTTSYRFYYKGRKKWDENNLPPLREVYEFYGRKCQFCLRPIKHIKDASRDHLYPRARSAGAVNNHVSNIVLMCKSCNSGLGDAFPKFNVDGEEIKAKFKAYPSHFCLPADVDLRPEWASLLFL